jgi:hypothetical protein
MFHNDGGYANPQGGRWADALGFRIGAAASQFPFFPLDAQHGIGMNYGPFPCKTNAASCLRNPNQTPTFGRVFRFNVARWYTLEFYYQLSSPAGSSNGILRAWIDGTQIYEYTGALTCNSGQQYGNCSGIGAILISDYHNNQEVTNLNGQTLYDNLVISRAGPIGVPGGGGGPTPPAAPTNLRIIGLLGVGGLASMIWMIQRRRA